MVQESNQFTPTLSTSIVLRYGLAKLSQHHPQGQLLSQSFDIQSPWILLHQVIRNILLDYVEDYVIGHVWSEGLLKARFREDYTQIITHRNQLVERINSYNIVSRSQFQRAHVEPHLVEMGIQICSTCFITKEVSSRKEQFNVESQRCPSIKNKLESIPHPISSTKQKTEQR